MSAIAIKEVFDKKELEKVFEIRRIVFVIEQNCPPELEWENEEVSHHFLATYDHQPAGVCRWRKTDSGYKLERFAVLKEFRGKGVGSALVAHTIKNLPADASYVYLHSQVDAMGLYGKHGFKPIGEMFEEAGIKHFKMVLSSEL